MSIDDTLYNLINMRKVTIYCEFNNINKENNFNIIQSKNKEGYLHQKFIIFDNSSVLFGTGNFTKNGIYDQFDVFIYSENEDIVKFFLDEINQYKKGIYGVNKKYLESTIICKDFSMKLFNSPSEKSYRNILYELRKAKDNVKIFTYAFTDPFFIYELQYLQSRGIKVEILSDIWNLQYNSPINELLDINIKYINNMHAKIIIVDDETYILGSYNFTYRAREKNDEFAAIIKNSKKVEIILNYFYLFIDN